MPNYLHKAGGTLEGGFPWSFGSVSTSSGAEAAAEAAWTAGINAMFTTASFTALLPTGTVLTYTSTSTATSDFKQTTKTQTDYNQAGTAAEGLPFQVAEVVTWRTASATKWGRGRWYLPPVAPGALDTAGFVLSSAAVTAIVDAVNNAITAWGTTIQLQILHRLATLSGPGADTLTPVTGGDVADKLVIQRRRGDKYVPNRTALTF